MRKDVILAKLPDPFMFEDGTRVQTVADWENRRKEIINTAVELEYGGMPPKPDEVRVEKLTDGFWGRAGCYRVHCMIGGKDFSFCFTTYLPSEPQEKCPVVLTGDAMYYQNCNDRVIEEAHRRGFMVVKFNRTEFAHDMYNTSRDTGLYPFFPDLQFSAVSAWAWGYHRVVDALIQLNYSYIDVENIAITGHSRGGKTVLLAGATDERIKFVNPNGSGAHGCGCYRFEQREEEDVYEDTRSETLQDLFGPVPYWMGKGMRAYIGRETELPHDMHFIKALVAPRYFLETNGYGDIWGNPRGSYLTHLAAKEIWKLYNEEQRCQTWYREGGHKHHFEEFCALFDFMEWAIYGKEWKEVVPYDDMSVLHDWTNPTGKL